MKARYLLPAIIVYLILVAGCTNTITTPSEEQKTVPVAMNIVEVQYRSTKVNLANPKFEYFNTDKSSFIEGAWYDSSNQYMVIKLSGKFYHYCGLPSRTWSSFKSADSFGEFFNQEIKGNYDCRSGTVPTYNYIKPYLLNVTIIATLKICFESIYLRCIGLN